MNQESRVNELWARILDDMCCRGHLNDIIAQQCLSNLRLVSDTGTKLVIEYLPGTMLTWIELNYEAQLCNSASCVLGGARMIEFVEASNGSAADAESVEPEGDKQMLLGLDGNTPDKGEQVEAAPAPVKRKRRSATQAQSFNSGLNEDYNFDNFVYGSNSEFAYAAAKAVAAAPGRLHNVLFIHGGSGMGKTHLMHAIGNAIRSANEDICVLYVTSEEFTNSYINALARKGEAMSNFRRKYRRADVLLIDDVHFLAQKSKTQDEFFHTFNALFDSGKQIVISAEGPAANVLGMDERLISRFEQGLSVALQPPDFETRMAILRRKCMQWKSNLISDDVLEFLAKSITRSVRRLEGALTCLVTFASFSQHRPTVAEARMQLRNFPGDEPATHLSIKDIQQRVADEFCLRVADLNGRCRSANIARPRQIAMYLARRHTGSSLQDIGAAFGGRDHGTVIHATRTIEQKLEGDPEMRAAISRVLSALGA